MDAYWIVLVPLLPFGVAVLIGVLHFCRLIDGEDHERITAAMSVWPMGLSTLLSLSFLITDLSGNQVAEQLYGSWLSNNHFSIDFSVRSSGFNLTLATLFAVLLLVVMRFSVNYLHREVGFHRFFFMLNLFVAAMMLLVLSGNALFTFVGWEVAGVCSYWLIAYAYDRPIAAHNATRVFVTNRVGDGGFILAIALTLLWLDSADWQVINNSVTELDRGDATLLALDRKSTRLNSSH